MGLKIKFETLKVFQICEKVSVCSDCMTSGFCTQLRYGVVFFYFYKKIFSQSIDIALIMLYI